MKGAALVVASLILASPLFAVAQAADGDGQGQGQATTEQPAKEPAPPLFPKHRRGLYRSGNGPPTLDATPQSPPLEVDDPGVPDKGQYEINFTTQGDLSKSVNEFDLFLVDANYGLAYKVFGHDVPTQLKLEFPLAGAQVSGQPFSTGLGACEVGVKFNFYNDEHKGVSLSFYPQLEFAPEGTTAVEKGLAEAGQTLVLPLLVRKELSEITLVMNATLRQPFHDPDRTTTGAVAVGVGRALTRHLVLMTELRLESAFDFGRDRLVAFNAGVMRSVGDKLVVYGNMGRSLFSDDGLAHTFVGFGLKVLTDSNKKSGQ